MNADVRGAWAVHSDVLDWLTASGSTEKIRKQSLLYRQQSDDVKQAVYRFVIECDPSILLEYNACLGNYVLNYYREATRIFQEVCYMIINQLNWIPCAEAQGQVSVVLRLWSLPTIEGYSTSSLMDIPPIQANAHLMIFSGMVSGLSTVTKYTQSTRYYCPSEHSATFDYIRLHRPGASEASTARNDFLCDKCNSLLLEDVTCRVLSDKMAIEMIPVDAVRKKKPQRLQSLIVIVRDELVRGLHIGQHCSIIGIPVYDVVETQGHWVGNVCLEANNVILDSGSLLPYEPSSLEICPEISKLLHDCSFSPWAFASSLAYIFAGSVTPSGTFHKLKLSILLSLVNVIASSQDDKSLKEKNVFHLLAIGHYTTEIQRLLSYASSLAPICCHHGALRELFGTVTRDRFGANAFIEGGSLLLAAGGVCLIDDVLCLKKETQTKLQSSMENGQILIDIPKRFTDELVQEQQQMNVSLAASIWGSCSPTVSRKGHAVTDTISMKDVVPLGKSLTDRFGLLVFNDEEDESDNSWAHSKLIEHMLSSSATPTSPTAIPQFHVNDKAIAELLYRAGSLKTEFSDSALDLVRAFYLASRRIRSSSVYGTDISVTGLHTMKSLAAAHAQLNLRTEVLEEDAVFAIYLYEEAMTSRYGVKPTPHFKDGNTDCYIGKEYDARMRQFHLYLLRFCASHGYLGISAREE